MAIFTLPHNNVTDQNWNPKMDKGSIDEIKWDMDVLLLISDSIFIEIMELLYPRLWYRNGRHGDVAGTFFYHRVAECMNTHIDCTQCVVCFTSFLTFLFSF